ncbi:MAG: hypothetical protein R3C32_11760 [Chloroflexota bacterium]
MARATRVCGSYDLIVHRLTDEWSVERNWALESGLMTCAPPTGIDPMLGFADDRTAAGCPWCGAPRTWWARLPWPRAALATGLRAGTPVVAGSADHVASAFSAGVIEPGDLLVKLGGSGHPVLHRSAARASPPVP